MLLVIGVYVVFLSICTCEPNESRQHIEQHQQPEGGLDIGECPFFFNSKKSIVV